jgi:hypothetical protein
MTSPLTDVPLLGWTGNNRRLVDVKPSASPQQSLKASGFVPRRVSVASRQELLIVKLFANRESIKLLISEDKWRSNLSSLGFQRFMRNLFSKNLEISKETWTLGESNHHEMEENPSRTAWLLARLGRATSGLIVVVMHTIEQEAGTLRLFEILQRRGNATVATTGYTHSVRHE